MLGGIPWPPPCIKLRSGNSTDAKGDISHTTAATTAENKPLHGTNFVTTKSEEDIDSQRRSRANSSWITCTICKSFVCIYEQSCSINHAPTFLSIYNYQSFADEGHTSHGSKTRGVSLETDGSWKQFRDVPFVSESRQG